MRGEGGGGRGEGGGGRGEGGGGREGMVEITVCYFVCSPQKQMEIPTEI